MSVSTPDLIFGEPQAPTTFAGTQYTRPLVVGGGSRCSFQLIHAGTTTAAVTVWTTNVPARKRDDATDTSWVQETGITFPNPPAGAASKSMLHLSDLGCQEIRLKFVTSSGTGTGEVWGKVGE
jgi:hypothetical protein